MSDDASASPAKRGRKPAAEKAEKIEKPEAKKRTKKVTIVVLSSKYSEITVLNLTGGGEK